MAPTGIRAWARARLFGGRRKAAPGSSDRAGSGSVRRPELLEDARPDVVAAIENSGLRALVHPLTDDDLADHTSLARWIGEPVELDVTVLDPPGHNQGVARFGRTDF